ncbi:DedA family protein [uncultured Cellulomonas sp.]|uniref:DedA family protein n=1 Tax=uncultured Cellulomonas sp. TaxID=189682 RepID=UPI00260D859D|nr:DedA family protein [uncultured Cellulomonas sp.]
MLEEWSLALAASPLVYLVTYLATTIDGFFPPIPSESVVIALAALATTTGAPSLGLLMAVAAAGAFTGDQLAYWLGGRVQVRSARLLRGKRAQRTLDRAEYALATRGASFIIGARYIPVGRVAVNMTAGAVRYPRARFVGLSAFAAVSWALYSTAIGVGAGAWLDDQPLVAVVVGVVGGAVIGLVVDAVLSRVQSRWRLRAVRQAAATVAEAAAPGEGSAVRWDGAGAGGGSPRPSGARREPAAMVLPRADR